MIILARTDCGGHYRMCPGLYLAEATLWSVMATVLATSTILKALDHEGKEIVPSAIVIGTFFRYLLSVHEG